MNLLFGNIALQSFHNFRVSESLIYRDYTFGFWKKGGIKKEYKGKQEGNVYLQSKGIKPVDEWGETIIFQIIDKEIFETTTEDYGTSLMDMKFDKYDLD